MSETNNITDINKINIGCIGCGTMGGAIIQSIAQKYTASSIYVSSAHYNKAKAFADKNRVTALKTNLEVAEKSDYIFLAVKPAYIKEVLQEIGSAFKKEKVIISMAAGITLNTLNTHCKTSPLSSNEQDDIMVQPHLIRIMPNLPATVGEAMTAIAPGSYVTEAELSIVKSLLECAGKAEVVNEKLMDGVTAVSGSGPAYAFMFIEALANAAVKFGMPSKQAYIYAAQTLKGAASLALEDGRSISELKDAVCSPGGTTIEGVIALEKKGFRGTIIDAATAAYNKSIDLGRK